MNARWMFTCRGCEANCAPLALTETSSRRPTALATDSRREPEAQHQLRNQSARRAVKFRPAGWPVSIADKPKENTLVNIVQSLGKLAVTGAVAAALTLPGLAGAQDATPAPYT